MESYVCRINNANNIRSSYVCQLYINITKTLIWMCGTLTYQRLTAKLVPSVTILYGMYYYYYY